MGGISAVCVSLLAQSSTDIGAHVPSQSPRTMVIDGRQKNFRAYCTTGEGSRPFTTIKADFDRDYLLCPFPDEPVTYGDPDPKERDSDKADKWRDVQDVCGRASGVAEAATLIWIVTGEEKYFAKAKEFLLKILCLAFRAGRGKRSGRGRHRHLLQRRGEFSSLAQAAVDLRSTPRKTDAGTRRRLSSRISRNVATARWRGSRKRRSSRFSVTLST